MDILDSGVGQADLTSEEDAPAHRDALVVELITKSAIPEKAS
jgi:hypothetical protein